jgi:hypothetical protein
MAAKMREEVSVGAELPEILQVIEGTLVVDTNDLATASIALKGFQYLLALEFARQLPALALLYDLDIQVFEPERGSIRFPFKIWINLKRHVAAELEKLKKAGMIATIAAVLSISTAIKDGVEVYHNLFPPIQNQLLQHLPSYKPIIEIADIRAADSRDIFDRETPGSHTI